MFVINLKINMKKIITIIAIFSIFFILKSQAQTKFLVSEYKNISGNTQGEWIELLVIEDNVSIVNYYIRDNSGEGLWMGGVKFRDVSLWRNLRKGTVILLYTRNNPGINDDLDAEDGFIRISAENTTFFEQILENGTTWIDNALNFNQTTECVHLIDNNGNHHHALSQSATEILTAVAVLPYPKVVHQSSSAAATVGFWGYGGGPYHQASGSDSTTNVSYEETPGYANLPPTRSITAKNHFYWRALRQPEWNNPKLTINLVSDGVKLSWNKAEDSYPQDKFQGYLILRHLKKDDPIAELPIDAYVYNEGTFIGPSKVIANVKGSDVTEFIDKNYDCNVEYVYRVFAYRYTNTGDETDRIPERGRGRSYNQTNFAQAEIRTPEAGTVSIALATNSQSTTCVGDTVTIIASVSSGNFRYEWLNNNIIFSQEKKDTLKIVVKQGTSRIALRILNEINCATISNEIVLEGLEIPKPYLAKKVGVKEEKITKNDTIYNCLGNDLQLVGSTENLPQAKIVWYKDGIKWIENQKNVNITANGVYYFEAINNDYCISVSPKVTVIFREYNFSIEPDSLTFVVNLNDNFVEQTVSLKNLANSPLEITQSMFILPLYYELIEPSSFPIIVPPNSSSNLKIRFSPPDYNLYKGRLIIKTPCNSKFTKLAGYKDAGKTLLSIGHDDISIGKFLYCNLPSEIDTTLEITALGNQDIILKDAINSNESEFQIVSVLPNKLQPFENFALKIKCNASTIGLHTTEIKIPYIGETNGTQYDTLLLRLSVEIYEPILQFQKSINIGKIENCLRDTIINLNLKNISYDEIELKQFKDNRLQILGLPIFIGPNEEREIQVYVKINQNAETIDDSVNYEPCSMSIPITINAEYGGIIPKLSSNIVDFETIYFCDENKTRSITLDLLNYKSPVKINQIIYENDNFSINYLENQELNDNNTINIRLNTQNIGNYSSLIKLIIGGCIDTVSIPVIANVIDLAYTLSSNVLEFGTVEPGNSEIRKFTFTNNSQNDIIISGIDFFDERFVIINPNTFPIKIVSNTSQEFEIKYTPKNYDENLELFALISIDAPCKINNRITLKGNSSKKKLNFDIAFEFPQNKLFIKTGDKTKIPVRLITTGASKLTDAEISEISFNVNYNFKILYPNAIFPGNAIINNYSKLTIKEFTPGIAKVIISLVDPIKLNDGNLTEIEFLGLLGNNLVSNLVLDSIFIKSPNDFTIKKLDGEVQITSDCLPDSRIIEFTTKPQIKLVNNFGNIIELEITKVSDGYFEISLYDLLGNKLISNVDIEKKAGKYQFIIDKSLFADGIYLISIKDDTNIITQSIIIKK